MEDIFGTGGISSGMVAIVGPPNAGKSTLLNCLLGQKISIVTPKPQTTRNRISGVLNDKDYQVVFIDTPGLHRADQPLNKEMVRVALESLSGVDAILFLLDAGKLLKRKKTESEPPTRYLENSAVPTFLVLNKTDLTEKHELLPLIEKYASIYPFRAVIPISAKLGDGTDELLEEIIATLPKGPRYFPEDVPTDCSERFLVSEIIREKVFLMTSQEIPYSTAVLVDSFKEEPKKVTIHASIVLEKSSQKGIIIGKGGQKLKSIGISARKDIEKMIDEKVVLKLFVKVKKNWSQSSSFLRELGL